MKRLTSSIFIILSLVFFALSVYFIFFENRVLTGIGLLAIAALVDYKAFKG